MRLYPLLSILICIISLNFFQPVKAEIDVNLIVQGCNNNAICEPISGEDIDTCPDDCTPLPPPASTPVPTYTGGTAQYSMSSHFVNFKIVYGDNSATLTWSTEVPTQSVISWGTTDDYGDGTLSEIGYSRNHTTTITGIIPEKEYFFNIQARDSGGNVVRYYDDFISVNEILPTRPQNVSLFRSFITTSGIGLRWINPADPDFDYVRIIRLDNRYPLNPSDGKIVYEGKGQSLVDVDVRGNIPYYYAAFVRNSAKVYSSGALLMAIKNVNGAPPLNPDLDSDTSSQYYQTPIIFPNIPEKPVEFSPPNEDFNNDDENPINEESSDAIELIQNNKEVSFNGNNIPTLVKTPFIVTFPKKESSEAFLVIYAGESGSDLPILVYLMRVNPETGRLEADVPGLDSIKPVNFSIHVLKNGSFEVLHQGIFDLHGTTSPVAENSTEFFRNVLLICSFLILLFILLLTLKRIF